MSANEQVEARMRLTELVYQALKELGMQRQDLAAKSRIPLSTLRRALNKPETTITDTTLRGIELGLGWPEYAADRILEDPDYRPASGPRPLNARTSTTEDIIGFLTAFLAAQPAEYRRFRATIDTQWPEP